MTTSERSPGAVQAGRSRPRSGRRIPDLGVDWHLPARTGDGFAPRRFASTTVASDLLIAVLAEDGATWSEVADAIRYDDEARAVASAFVQAGHGDVAARSMLASR